MWFCATWGLYEMTFRICCMFAYQPKWGMQHLPDTPHAPGDAGRHCENHVFWHLQCFQHHPALPLTGYVSLQLHPDIASWIMVYLTLGWVDCSASCDRQLWCNTRYCTGAISPQSLYLRLRSGPKVMKGWETTAYNTEQPTQTHFPHDAWHHSQSILSLCWIDYILCFIWWYIFLYMMLYYCVFVIMTRFSSKWFLGTPCGTPSI